MKKTLVVFMVFAALAFGFTWKVWVKGEVPFPGDLLVGAYDPWRKESIPIQNPLISDVFSQIYPWKKMIAESLVNGKLPLWNPYTLSGYPLLANFHSGALYPLNLLLVGNFAKGWSWLLWWQLFGSGCFMYVYLRSLKYPWGEAILGGIGYAYSGFSLVMWQMVHAGHALMWLPLVLLAIERKKLVWVPILFFPLITAGHFQVALYSLLLAGGYIFLKSGISLGSAIKCFAVLGLALGVSAMQLLPTIRMSGLSVRGEEKYIANRNFGLLPPSNLARLVAPDFFGNPVTGNYWGSFNYQETTVYLGVLAVIGLILGTFSWKELRKTERFYLVVTALIVLFVIDSPFARFVFSLNLPGISTSSAARMAGMLALPGSVFAAASLRLIKNARFKKTMATAVVLGILLVLGLTSQDWTAHTRTITRNLIFPAGLVAGILLGLWLTNWRKFFVFLLVPLVIWDLFRFGLKYNPFTDASRVFPSTDEIRFLLERAQNFRVDRENDAVLPPNTWEYYGLKSPSGYDPLTVSSYARNFHENLNMQKGAGGSRYTVLDRLDSPNLSEYGVKYLMTKNRGDKSSLFSPPGWNKVYSNERVIIWENQLVRETFFLDDTSGEVKITKFEPGSVNLMVTTKKNSYLKWIFSTWDGWQARVDNLPGKVISDGRGFFGLNLSPGLHEVKMRYFPKEVAMGTIVTFFSVIVCLAGAYVFPKKKNFLAATPERCSNLVDG